MVTRGAWCRIALFTSVAGVVTGLVLFLAGRDGPLEPWGVRVFVASALAYVAARIVVSRQARR